MGDGHLALRSLTLRYDSLPSLRIGILSTSIWHLLLRPIEVNGVVPIGFHWQVIGRLAIAMTELDKYFDEDRACGQPARLLRGNLVDLLLMWLGKLPRLVKVGRLASA
jgi:hypothetical protein